MPKYDLTLKANILEDAKKRIWSETLEEIAQSHGICKKTLNNWLMSLGDEYQELRKAWLDNMLSDAKEAIDEADDTFPLNKAREQWKYATWYAERRDPDRYGANKLNINITSKVEMSEALGNEANKLLESIAIEGESERVENDT